jgi:hypothetical protein
LKKKFKFAIKKEKDFPRKGGKEIKIIFMIFPSLLEPIK